VGFGVEAGRRDRITTGDLAAAEERNRQREQQAAPERSGVSRLGLHAGTYCRGASVRRVRPGTIQSASWSGPDEPLSRVRQDSRNPQGGVDPACRGASVAE
jgi:hypothetical protein